MKNTNIHFDPIRDLVLERVVPLRREDVWAAWTTPALLKQWFAPRPWTISSIEMEPSAGGATEFTMASPEGQEYPNRGCILEFAPNERLVFTDCLEGGFRPCSEPFFTAVIELEDHPEGTLYRATAMHKDTTTREKHEQMGFHSGWAQCLDQLVNLMSGCPV